MLLVRFVLGDLQRRAQLAERERDLGAREAVVEERARIARELHDAIAHNVSMMGVQAGAERRVLGAGSGSTHEATVELEILDDGTGAEAPVATGGHGLVGMRERVALYGGTLHAARRPTGGFAIRVLLPAR